MSSSWRGVSQDLRGDCKRGAEFECAVFVPSHQLLLDSDVALTESLLPRRRTALSTHARTGAGSYSTVNGCRATSVTHNCTSLSGPCNFRPRDEGVFSKPTPRYPEIAVQVLAPTLIVAMLDSLGS